MTLVPLWALIFAVQPAGNPQAVEEVAAGKCKVAQASWWGFDPAESTAALQAAINSTAKKVVVEKMPSPWILDKLRLADDQELFFEPGVEVLAKKGGFHGTSDSLFSAAGKKNIRLIGPGAVLRMRRADYDNKADYKHAEWRHVINLHGCTGVTIEGLTLAESGGDGIYLGAGPGGKPCKDVIIRDVVCDRNYRQGISVISAENLLIERCTLKDTAGTPPAVVDRLQASLQKMKASPDVQEQFKKMGLDPLFSKPADFGAFIIVDSAKWAELIQKSGATAE